jgi:hypothetical protein
MLQVLDLFYISDEIRKLLGQGNKRIPSAQTTHDMTKLAHALWLAPDRAD